MAAPIDYDSDSRIEVLLAQLIEKVEEGGGGSGGGTVMTYGGRVNTVYDLPLTGLPNQYYFVGLVNATDFDEYVWAEVEGGTGHWDHLGSVSLTIDDELSLSSSNPVSNSVVTEELNKKSSVDVRSNGDIYVDGGLIRKVLTQAEYDAMETPNPTVMYVIVG